MNWDAVKFALTIGWNTAAWLLGSFMLILALCGVSVVLIAKFERWLMRRKEQKAAVREATRILRDGGNGLPVMARK